MRWHLAATARACETCARLFVTPVKHLRSVLSVFSNPMLQQVPLPEIHLMTRRQIYCVTLDPHSKEQLFFRLFGLRAARNLSDCGRHIIRERVTFVGQQWLCCVLWFALLFVVGRDERLHALLKLLQADKPANNNADVKI